MKKSLFSCFIFLLLSLPSQAQFSLDVENDVIQLRRPTMTDRYFTNAVRFNALGNFWRRLPTAFFLIKFKENSDLLYGFALGQHIYTPIDLTQTEVITTDRPYAGWLYLSHSLIATDAKHQQKLTTELDLGVIGQLSLAAEIQRKIHEWGNFTEPKGWGNQIKNDVGINYYVKYEKRFLPQFHKSIDFIPCVEGHIGTVTNYIGVGTTLRVGVFNDYFSTATGLYERKREKVYQDTAHYKEFYDEESLSKRKRKQNVSLDSLIAKRANNKWQVYFFIQPLFRTVLDNSFLQGGWTSSRRSPHIISADRLRRFYAQTEFGFVVSYAQCQVSLSHLFRTAEFEGAFNQQWGKVSITVGF